MDSPTLSRVLGRLQSRPTSYAYVRDRLALVLLALHVGVEGLPVAALKRSTLKGLLSRCAAREVLARSGGGRIRAGSLIDAARAASNTRVGRGTPYTVTFSRWGADASYWSREDYQMSRRGMNLVVQLNFPAAHDRDFRRLVRPDRMPLHWGHPVRRDTLTTLAWVRVDVDLRRREALIEEIQSDWVRDLDFEVLAADDRFRSVLWRRRPTEHDARRLRTYRDRVLAPCANLWQEAALSAAIEVLVTELDVQRVLLHTPATGCALKGIRWSGPPRSLYSDLPRRFAFTETTRPPELLLDRPDPYLRDQLGNTDLSWWEHDWSRASVRKVAALLSRYREVPDTTEPRTRKARRGRPARV